jgi:hypothetical protein
MRSSFVQTRCDSIHIKTLGHSVFASIDRGSPNGRKDNIG